MPDTWFRRAFLVPRPTDWRGRALVTAGPLLALGLFVLAERVGEGTEASAILGAFGMVILFSVLGIVLWKTDWEYERD